MDDPSKLTGHLKVREKTGDGDVLTVIERAAVAATEHDWLSHSESDSDGGHGVCFFRPSKSTEHLYHKACDYRPYRLECGRGRMDARANRDLRQNIKDLEVTMIGH